MSASEKEQVTQRENINSFGDTVLTRFILSKVFAKGMPSPKNKDDVLYFSRLEFEFFAFFTLFPDVS